MASKKKRDNIPNEENLKQLGKKLEDDEEEDQPKQKSAQKSAQSPAKDEHEEHHKVEPPCHHDLFRVTIIDPIGDIAADTGPGSIYVTNGNGYNSRPEVIWAITKGEGFASRPNGNNFGWYYARQFASDDHPDYRITVRVTCNQYPSFPK